MIQYVDNGDLAIFDGLSFRRDKKTGYYLNARTHKRLHVYVWEYFNGTIPKGYEIHHVDFDKKNNEIENLKMLTSKEHHEIHGAALTECQREWRRKNLAENARPKASEWHGSDAGAEWHRQHYEKVKDKMHVTKKFACEYCGKEFESTQVNSKFCSNKCRAAARRRSGVDNIVKICERCGGEYKANKYQKTKYCESCRRGAGRN